MNGRERIRRAAAFFDVDRTLLPGHTMERIFLRYLLAEGQLTPTDLARFLGGALRGLIASPGGSVLHSNKQHLRNKDADALERLAGDCFAQKIAPRLSPAGREAVRKHLALGHMVVLLTGSLQPLAEALRRELGAHLALAARLEQKGGSLSGELSNQRPYGQEKARLVRGLAGERGLDLAACFAYGDHHSDNEVLQAVGNPRAVNPDRRLAALARARGWPILSFQPARP